MSKFEQLCESYGVLETTKRMRYPRQVRFSEDFLKALESEFTKHTLDEKSGAPINNKPEKFLKALKFHLHDLATRPQPIEEVKSPKIEEK
jgi:hypothetical protein